MTDPHELEARAACAEHGVTGCAGCYPETYGRGKPDYSVEAQPASEDLANIEQMLEGMEMHTTPITLAALATLLTSARKKCVALEAELRARQP